MTNLFDVTIQHLGWSGGSFANGGWGDWSPPLATGLHVGSWRAQSLNGVAIDQAMQFVEGDGTPPAAGGYVFNVHTNGAVTGSMAPPGYLVTPNTRIYTYTRVPQANDAILWRVIVSDQPTTPPPTSPP